MKKLLSFAVLSAILASSVFTSVEAKNTYRPKSDHSYNIGPKGGCYYINSHGKKTYVDRNLCG